MSQLHEVNTKKTQCDKENESIGNVNSLACYDMIGFSSSSIKKIFSIHEVTRYFQPALSKHKGFAGDSSSSLVRPHPELGRPSS